MSQLVKAWEERKHPRRRGKFTRGYGNYDEPYERARAGQSVRLPRGVTNYEQESERAREKEPAIPRTLDEAIQRKMESHILKVTDEVAHHGTSLDDAIAKFREKSTLGPEVWKRIRAESATRLKDLKLMKRLFALKAWEEQEHPRALAGRFAPKGGHAASGYKTFQRGDSTVITHIRKADVWPLVSRAFPTYAGKKFKMDFSPKITFYDTNWGGGTRNYYTAIRLETGEAGPLRSMAPWNNPVEGQTVDLPKDIVVVEHSIFMGKDMGITIHAHPDHLPKWLPASTTGAQKSFLWLAGKAYKRVPKGGKAINPKTGKTVRGGQPIPVPEKVGVTPPSANQWYDQMIGEFTKRGIPASGWADESEGTAYIGSDESVPGTMGHPRYEAQYRKGKTWHTLDQWREPKRR